VASRAGVCSWSETGDDECRGLALCFEDPDSDPDRRALFLYKLVKTR
jgi:hypothetical protein